MSTIQRFSNTAITHAANAFALLSTKGQNIPSLAPLEVMLAAPLALGLLYQMGQAYNQGKHQHVGKRLMYSVGEAGVTQLIAENTRNVYPLLPLAWGAYEVGNSNTKEDRYKALIKSATLFTLGYAGIVTGRTLSNQLNKRTADNVIHIFEQQKFLDPAGDLNFKEALDKILQLPDPPKNGGKLTLAHIKDELGQFKASAKELRSLFDKIYHTTPLDDKTKRRLIDQFKLRAEEVVDNTQTFKNFIPKFQQAEDAFLAKLGMFTREHLDGMDRPTRKALESLGNIAKGSQGYRLPRFLNPMMGYLIGVGLIAPLVVRFLCDLFIPNHRTMTTSVTATRPPLWADRLFGDNVRNHTAMEHTHPYNMANGPAMLNNYWEGR